MPTLKVAGFDPAFRNWGVALADIDLDTLDIDITGLHLLRTEDKTETASKASITMIRRSADEIRRAKELITGIRALVEDVDLIFSEVSAGSLSARAARQLGIVAGIIAGTENNLIQIQPFESKLVACNNSRATKRNMIEWAHGLYPNAPWIYRKFRNNIILVPENEHLADAVGAIHAGIMTPAFADILPAMREIARKRVDFIARHKQSPMTTCA